MVSNSMAAAIFSDYIVVRIKNVLDSQKNGVIWAEKRPQLTLAVAFFYFLGNLFG